VGVSRRGRLRADAGAAIACLFLWITFCSVCFVCVCCVCVCDTLWHRCELLCIPYRGLFVKAFLLLLGGRNGFVAVAHTPKTASAQYQTTGLIGW
jgi:hypothetical protein